MKTAWPTLCEMIRKDGNAELNALLDRYQRKLFSGYTTCWARSARNFILARAIALGVISESEDEDD